MVIILSETPVTGKNISQEHIIVNLTDFFGIIEP